MRIFGTDIEITRASRRSNVVTVESPSVSFADWIDGKDPKTEYPVTDKTALTLSAVYACIKVISETIAELPLNLYTVTGDGKQEVDNDLAYLIGKNPNQNYSSYTFRQALMASCLLYGNGYAFIDRTKQSATPTRLVLLDPNKVEVKEVEGTGELLYVITNGTKQIPLEQWQVLHIKGMTLTGVLGLSPLESHAGMISSGLALQDFGNKFFTNGTLSTGIIKAPGKLDQKAATSMRREWQRQYTGSKNLAKVIVLDAGQDYQQLSINPEQAQFLASRNYNVEDICRVYRVPQHMIQKLDRATNNNIEHQSLEFLQYCILPHCKNIEQELDRKTLRDKRQYWKFNVNALMRGDAKSRAEYYTKMVNMGAMTRNEVRALENMNRIEGLDAPLQPLNMTTNLEGETNE